MRVTDEVHAGQREQISVEDRLDGRFFRVRIVARSEERVIDRRVRHRFLLEQRQQGGEAALGHAGGAERREVGAAGLDEERVRRDAGGSIALAEDRQPAFFAAELVREIEEAVQSFGGRSMDGERTSQGKIPADFHRNFSHDSDSPPAGGHVTAARCPSAALRRPTPRWRATCGPARSRASFHRHSSTIET